jgi:hypothetical protein
MYRNKNNREESKQQRPTSSKNLKFETNENGTEKKNQFFSEQQPTSGTTATSVDSSDTPVVQRSQPDRRQNWWYFRRRKRRTEKQGQKEGQEKPYTKQKKSGRWKPVQPTTLGPQIRVRKAASVTKFRRRETQRNLALTETVPRTTTRDDPGLKPLQNAIEKKRMTERSQTEDESACTQEGHSQREEERCTQEEDTENSILKSTPEEDQRVPHISTVVQQLIENHFVVRRKPVENKEEDKEEEERKFLAAPQTGATGSCHPLDPEDPEFHFRQRLVPDIPIDRYLVRIMKYLYIPPEEETTFMTIVLVYLDRFFLGCWRQKVEFASLHMLFFVSALLAYKFFYDTPQFMGKHLAQVSGFEIPRIRQAEKHFLRTVNFELFIQETTFELYKNNLPLL